MSHSYQVAVFIIFILLMIALLGIGSYRYIRWWLEKELDKARRLTAAIREERKQLLLTKNELVKTVLQRDHYYSLSQELPNGALLKEHIRVDNIIIDLEDPVFLPKNDHFYDDIVTYTNMEIFRVHKNLIISENPY